VVTADATSLFHGVDEVIRARRTSLLLEPTEVPTSLIDTICELATWAPCHKRTWPWEFASYTGDARERLGHLVAEALAQAGAETAKVDKARVKYLRAPAVVVVGARHGDGPVHTAENRDAVAAGVQNLLLGATALGLASYWSSCPQAAQAAVAESAGFGDAATIVAMIYLGWPSRPCPAPPRPPARVLHLG
jgi:nitroreductase